MDKSKIHYHIKDKRKAEGFTQKELGAKVGVARATISSWERGRTEPSIMDIERLAHVFGCSKESLISGDRYGIYGEVALKMSRLDLMDILLAGAYIDGLLSNPKYKKMASSD